MEMPYMPPDMSAGRVPPHNLEAEQSVLGCMLLDIEAVTLAAEILMEEDFYAPANKEIFACAVALYAAARPVDMVTVGEELMRRGTMEGVGGIPYLTDLSRYVPATSNAAAYIRIVKDRSLLRRLAKAGTTIAQESFTAAKETQAILQDAEKAIFDIAMDKKDNGFIHIKPALVSTYAKIEQVYADKRRITGVPSGFTDLDYCTSGFHAAELILVAARPSMGKTSFVMNIVEHAALKENVPVAVFSLEMPSEQLTQRMLCSQALVELQRVRTGDLEEEDFRRIMRAMAPLSQAPIYIDDTPAITALDMRSRCRRLKVEKGLGMIVIDYLQLMGGSGRSDSRQQEISEITRSLKILARELEVPVVVLSQLSRAPEQRSDHRPMLSDLRESGAIEQDADIVMFLYRDEYYNPESEDGNKAEVIIAKQRNGPTRTLNLAWMGQYTRFVNLQGV